MNTMNVVQARAHIRDLLDSVLKGQSVTITRHGQAVAIVLPADLFTTTSGQ